MWNNKCLYVHPALLWNQVLQIERAIHSRPLASRTSSQKRPLQTPQGVVSSCCCCCFLDFLILWSAASLKAFTTLFLFNLAWTRCLSFPVQWLWLWPVNWWASRPRSRPRTRIARPRTLVTRQRLRPRLGSQGQGQGLESQGQGQDQGLGLKGQGQGLTLLALAAYFSPQELSCMGNL